MAENSICDFLHTQVALFGGFPIEALDEIVNASRMVSFEPNEAIIEFGEEGKFLGVHRSPTTAASATV